MPSSIPSRTKRRHLHFNPEAKHWVAPINHDYTDILKFHQKFPGYESTPLVTLPDVAAAVGVAAVYVKDESQRCGLPAFKILGASWGTYRAITKRLDLPLNTTIDALQQTLSSSPLTLYAATDGNHGRAVGRLAALLGISSQIHVPRSMKEDIIELIRQEGAKVVVSQNGYDASIQEAYIASQHEQGLLIQDYAFGDYTEIPQWIVEGYSTMMQEADAQLHGQMPDLVIAPVGVGSFAQSVVTHFKKDGSTAKVMTVEPDTAACLWRRLERGEMTTPTNAPTIMAGLDCSTVSDQSWPILRSGVDVSATVSDYESHAACALMQKLGIAAGPCGAAPLAALTRLTNEEKLAVGIDKYSVVLMICTEGQRAYDTPIDVSVEDPVALTQTLIQFNSANPATGSLPGHGGTDAAKFICSWFEYRDIDSHWVEPIKGRPSVVAIAKGTGGGKVLLLNGPADTVTLVGHDGNSLGGNLEIGKSYAGGSAGRKSGVVAQMVAAANIKKLGLRGDVIVTAVADEEMKSIGTTDAAAAVWHADAAVVSECTDLQIIRAHKGFVWFDFTVYGVAAHGSRPDLGFDAIFKAGYVLAELDRYAKQLQEGEADPVVGLPSAHARLIQGGEEESSYPAQCKITIERRTVRGKTSYDVEKELRGILDLVAKKTPGFKYDLEATFSRPAFFMEENDPLVLLVAKHAKSLSGIETSMVGAPFWRNSALLLDAGIPTIVFGPLGQGSHAKSEWADARSVEQACDILTKIGQEFCA